MPLEASILKTIDEVCAVFEEEGLTEDYASETVRVVRSLAYGKKAVIDSCGRLAIALQKRFSRDHQIWDRVSFADSNASNLAYKIDKL